MINQLLDEASDLTDLSLRILSLFPHMRRTTYFNHTISYWRIKGDAIEIDSDLRYYGDFYKEEIERNFKNVLSFNLGMLNLTLDDYMSIDPGFLINYRNKWDLNDLVVTSFCLDLLVSHFNASPSIYLEVEEFVNEFCPEATEFFRALILRNFNKTIDDFLITAQVL